MQEFLKESKEQEEAASKADEIEEREQNNTQFLKEITESTKKTREIQATTGDYLKQLHKLTEANNKIAKNNYEGKKNDNDSLAALFGKSTLGALDKFGKRLKSSASGPNNDVKNIFTGTGEMISGGGSLLKNLIKGTKKTTSEIFFDG